VTERQPIFKEAHERHEDFGVFVYQFLNLRDLGDLRGDGRLFLLGCGYAALGKM
jgi:hypothetical protein